MTDAILVNGVTPEKLTETILNGVRNQLDELKKGFTPKEPEDFLKPIETAKLLKISLTTVFDHANTGVLKRYKLGNRTYFSRKEIESTLFNSNK